MLFNNHVKSANKFGFFLMASLIMLSVSAALIGNMNLFSDAMASGKHSDKNDNYQEYEKVIILMIINTHQIIIIIMNR